MCDGVSLLVGLVAVPVGSDALGNAPLLVGVPVGFEVDPVLLVCDGSVGVLPVPDALEVAFDGTAVEVPWLGLSETLALIEALTLAVPSAPGAGSSAAWHAASDKMLQTNPTFEELRRTKTSD